MRNLAFTNKIISPFFSKMKKYFEKLLHNVSYAIMNMNVNQAELANAELANVLANQSRASECENFESCNGIKKWHAKVRYRTLISCLPWKKKL